MTSANSNPLSPYCQPIMSYPPLWANITAFNACVKLSPVLYFHELANDHLRYLSSLLGMGMSSCGGTSITQYTTPSLLSKAQMESVISQMAAEFMWLGSSRNHMEL